jgi:hypothetical protein
MDDRRAADIALKGRFGLALALARSVSPFCNG